MTRLAPLLLCLLSGCIPLPAQNGIPNFAWVDQSRGICRGGQPNPAQFAWLVAQGVTNDVKLNTGKDVAPGMTVKAFPISTWRQIFGGKALAAKLDAAEKAIGPGTLIHCTAGKNRTGSAIIAFRVKGCAWGKPEAIAEANRYGWQSSFPGLKAYVKQMPPAMTFAPGARASQDALTAGWMEQRSIQERSNRREEHTNRMRLTNTNLPPIPR